MIDPELKQHLETIEKELRDLRKDSTGLGATLLRGLIYGAGYIIGAVLIIVLIGWILNIIGIIPAFTTQVTEFRDALNRIGGPVK
jgi:uncharacterized membrane protein